MKIRYSNTVRLSAGLILTLLIVSCQKQKVELTENPLPEKKEIKTGRAVNPYSLKNVQKARKVVAQKTGTASSTNRISQKDQPSEYAEFVYFKFTPEALSTDEFKGLENDTTVTLLDFPFANTELYDETFALDEEKKEKLKDGNVYGVTPIENEAALKIILSNDRLKTTLLDTLVLIPEEDTSVQYESYRQAGASEEQIARFRICLLKRPTGYVRYWDNEFNRLEPVRNMQVWGLVFGIPLHTYTNANGYYYFPWRFSAGTIMGTHAKNSRVNIKPFNTMGGFFQVVGQLIVNFIVGSVHVKGWVSSCDMRNDVNFDFYDHKQNKYWSQLLNAYYFHDVYAGQDGIKNAPQNMVCYAHWADAGDFGSASTPMLYHLTGGIYTDQFINWFAGNQVTGTLLQLIHGLLPDMTFKVCGGTAPTRYNCRLTQIAFHELGHASMYRQVGAGWHLQLAIAELSHTYGNPGYNNWGKVQVAESWAEYIGTQNALRRYPSGVKTSSMLGFPTAFSTAMENEDWFAEPTRWIPCGVYFDLVDRTNNFAEPWDRVGGSNNQQLFNVFHSGINSMCDYREKFISNYPAYNQTDVRTLFAHYNLSCD